jgi:hypothetical protein
LLDSFREDAQAQGFDTCDGLIARHTVRESAGNLGDLGDPAAVGFLFGLNGEGHERMMAQTALKDKVTLKRGKDSSTDFADFRRLGDKKKNLCGSA